jgi:iron complex outermembrane receptor protein
VNDHTFVYNNIAPNNTQKITDLSAKITHDFDAMTLTAWAAHSDVRNSLVADGTSAGFQMFTTMSTRLSPARPAPAPALRRRSPAIHRLA